MITISLIVLFDYLLVFGTKKKFSISYEESCRIGSITHAFICTTMSALFLIGSIDYSLYKYSAIYNIIHCVNDLYLFSTKRISNNEIIEYFIHHILFIYCALASYINPYIFAKGILTEGSTVLLNIYWFSKNNKYKHTNKILGLFWLSFLIFRIINLNLITYEIYNSEYSSYIIIIIPFLILNKIWFYKISSKIYREYKKLK